jgi:hypothetical protein
MVLEHEVIHYLIKRLGKDRIYPHLDIKYHNLKTFLVPLDSLHPHEGVYSDIVEYVINDILSAGFIKYPIVVDIRTLTILDGHHRYNAFKKLGLKYIPAFLVDYAEDYISVYPLRKEIAVSKTLIIETALRKITYPPKTSRHVYIGFTILPTYTSIKAIEKLESKNVQQDPTLPVLQIEIN